MKITLEGTQKELTAIIQKSQWPFPVNDEDDGEFPNVRINLRGFNVERFTDEYDGVYVPKEKRPEEYCGNTF